MSFWEWWKIDTARELDTGNANPDRNRAMDTKSKSEMGGFFTVLALADLLNQSHANFVFLNLYEEIFITVEIAMQNQGLDDS